MGNENKQLLIFRHCLPRPPLRHGPPRANDIFEPWYCFCRHNSGNPKSCLLYTPGASRVGGLLGECNLTSGNPAKVTCQREGWLHFINLCRLKFSPGSPGGSFGLLETFEPSETFRCIDTFKTFELLTSLGDPGSPWETLREPRGAFGTAGSTFNSFEMFAILVFGPRSPKGTFGTLMDPRSPWKPHTIEFQTTLGSLWDR